MDLMHNFSVLYLDTCLPDYLQDHHTREFECMVGVTPIGQPDEEVAGEAVYRELLDLWGEKIPADIIEFARKPLLQGCQAAAKGVDWRTIDAEGNRLGGSISDHDDKEISDSQAWFLLTWEKD